MDQLVLFALPTYCQVEGCERPVKQKTLQLCAPHYRRHWRHGDPLAGGPERPRLVAAKAVVDLADGTRQCRDCGEAKHLDEFPRDKGGTRGRRPCCKPCHSATARRWYSENQERQQTRQRNRRTADVDRYRELDRQRYEREKPQRIAYATAAVHRRRALMAQVEFEPGITVKSLRKRHGDVCCYCGLTMTFTPGNGRTYVPAKATIEHIVAITRGGGHTWANTTLACWQCNVRKNAKPLDEWLASTQVSGESVA